MLLSAKGQEIAEQASCSALLKRSNTFIAWHYKLLLSNNTTKLLCHLASTTFFFFFKDLRIAEVVYTSLKEYCDNYLCYVKDLLVVFCSVEACFDIKSPISRLDIYYRPSLSKVPSGLRTFFISVLAETGKPCGSSTANITSFPCAIVSAYTKTIDTS